LQNSSDLEHIKFPVYEAVENRVTRTQDAVGEYEQPARVGGVDLLRPLSGSSGMGHGRISGFETRAFRRTERPGYARSRFYVRRQVEIAATAIGFPTFSTP